ncbi:cytochrome c oxidase assembly factor Coa1 family protein [Veronia pacifica]|uniref:Cytochrome oxidase complex assembly protein 1 n=1 Tax=Veronia pacifica TaxID=1080227 RepID=A0A1C3EQ32_9GAMM|nr:cytochrome c oxidase assembly factor Coa1 family protein [Veronia pacifica]ODA35363.1 hypothetical protein A8L45_04145 [Veronia pacifica]
MDNDKYIPEEIKGWNWGAFLTSIIWGIRFKCYKTFLVYIPLFGFFYLFVVGARANQWAWQNNHWESIEAFKATQKKWTLGTLVFYIALIAFAVTYVNKGVSEFENAPYASLALVALEQSESFQANIGKPYEYSLYAGTQRGYEAKGFAEMTFDVQGVNGKGKLFVNASHVNQVWQLECLSIQYANSKQPDILIPCD